MFDAKETCGKAFVKQWIQDIVCDGCAKKLMDDPETFNLFAMDNATVCNELEYSGIYNKKLNHFVESPKGNVSKMQCNVKSEVDGMCYEKCYTDVVYIDLVAFKAINTFFGESMGDAFIMYAANYIRECVGDKWCMVARKGGDEFNVFFMEKPRCLGMSEIERKESPSANLSFRRDEVHERIFKPYTRQKVEIYYPINKRSEGIVVPSKEGKLKGMDERRYHFVLLLQGLFFHYGVGGDPKEALNNKGMEHGNGKAFTQNKKSRGEFAKETIICVVDENGSEKEVSLFNHLIFVTKNLEVWEKINKSLCKYEEDEVVVHKDKYTSGCIKKDISEAYLCVVGFNDSKDEREDLLKKMCKHIQEDISCEGVINRMLDNVFTLSNVSIKSMNFK